MKSLYDSDQFAYKDLQVQVDGRNLIGLLGLKYSEKTEFEYVYGAGNKPIAIAEGNIAYEGELSLLQNELELLIKQAPNGRLAALKGVQITATYSQDDVLVTDIMVGVRFPEMGKELSQNDKHMKVTLPLMFLDLKLNQ